MNKLIVAVCTAGLLTACSKTPGVNELKPTNNIDTVSYAIGTTIGHKFAQDTLGLNIEMVAAAMRDAIADKSLFNQTQTDSVMRVFSEKMMAKRGNPRDPNNPPPPDPKALAAAKAEGEAFLAQNKTQPGVITTASGLQYKIEKQGTGPKPGKNDKVKVHYEGRVVSGKVFDTDLNGEPTSFPVSAVIPGWIEGLQLMPVGSKFKFFIPSELAYGERGASQLIPPNSVLIFDVELLGIEK